MDGGSEIAKGVRVKSGDRVIVEYPGYSLHGKAGKIVRDWTDDFLGKLFVISVAGFPEVSLDAAHIRPLASD